MSDPSVNIDRVLDLTQAICDKSASENDFVELDAILLADQASRRYYLDSCRMRVALRFELRASRAAQKTRRQIDVESVVSAPIELNVAAGESPSSAPGTYPTLAFLGNTIHGNVGNLSGWLVAYLVATVIFGIGLVVGALVHVSSPVQVAQQFASLPSPLSPLPSVVGRITGMVDCKWERQGLGIRDWGLEGGSQSKVQGSDLPSPFGRGARGEGIQSPIPNPQSLVSLGDTFILSSGLMEITYDTGAKVILQGPVTFEVESKDSGFLSLGKLTARLEKKVASGQWSVARKSEISNPQSRISNPSLSTLHSPLFTIKTPTAIVTDLGTEFGVEVSKEGHTISHVFRGSVELRTTSVAEEAMPVVRVLHADESALVVTPVAAQQSQTGEIRPVLVDAQQFVRRLSYKLPAKKNALPMQVIAWFRMGEDDPGAIVGEEVVTKTVNHNGYYHLAPRTRPTYSANAAPGGSSVSVSFSGAPDECLVGYHVPYTMTEDFILEAWVCPRAIATHFQFIAYNGDPNRNGYGLFIRNRHWHFLFGGNTWTDSGVPCELGKWTHLSLVSCRNSTQLWVNGRPVGEPIHDIPITPDTSFSIGCDHTSNPPFSFNGEIDEVRLSKLLGPFSPEMLLFKPTPPTGEKGETGQ